IFRHKKAIPQYESSSADRFAAINELQKQYPGLVVAGNLKGGIGMADRIKQAFEIARER
ncbi:MAG TPA: protoporphyrinogen oxidase, partial [Bacteroides fragilis]|nr:protoporphyrinogen oxidase [Bacteroides fragilis]